MVLAPISICLTFVAINFIDSKQQHSFIQITDKVFNDCSQRSLSSEMLPIIWSTLVLIDSDDLPNLFSVNHCSNNGSKTRPRVLKCYEYATFGLHD